MIYKMYIAEGLGFYKVEFGQFEEVRADYPGSVTSEMKIAESLGAEFEFYFI